MNFEGVHSVYGSNQKESNPQTHKGMIRKGEKLRKET